MKKLILFAAIVALASCGGEVASVEATTIVTDTTSVVVDSVATQVVADTVVAN